MIDFHTHLAPTLDSAHVDSDPGLSWSDGKYRVDGQSVGPAALYDAGELIRYLDGAAVDRAIVSVPPPFYRQGLASAGWAERLNDGLLESIGDSERLLPLAYLPLDDPAAAAAEVLRVSDDKRWAGFVGAAGGGSRALASSDLDALWSSLDHRAAILFLHPGHSHDERLADFYLHNLLGNPVETGVATAQLVFGGITSRFPAIRFVLAHGGGVVPSMVGRWQRGLETERPGIDVSVRSPREAVQQLWADCLTHDDGALVLAESVFGRDKIVLGSDWPFPMGRLGALETYTTPEAAERIGVVNPSNLLREPSNHSVTDDER